MNYRLQLKRYFFTVGLGTICATPRPHLPVHSLKEENKGLAYQGHLIHLGDILVSSWALPAPVL